MSRALFIIAILIFVVATAAVGIEARPVGTGCYIGADAVTIEEVYHTLWIHLQTEESGSHHLKVEGVWSGVVADFDYSYDAESSFYYLVAFAVVPDIYLVTNSTPSGSGCMTIVQVGPSSITPPEESQVQLPGGPSNYCYDVSYSLQGDNLIVSGHIAGEGLNRGIVDWGEESTALSFPDGDFFEVDLPVDQAGGTVSVVLADGLTCSQAHVLDGQIHKDW
jgi:hypothetical protein